MSTNHGMMIVNKNDYRDYNMMLKIFATRLVIFRLLDISNEMNSLVVRKEDLTVKDISTTENAISIK